jgi:thioesterase domain-containing protein
VSVVALLAELRGRGVQVWPDGGQLRCNAPAGVLTPELRDTLRQNKSDILEFLCSAEALARQERAIVPLQPHGERVPVFGVAGHNGDVFCYRALAQHLGNDQPFFGLQPPGLDGQSEPIACVEDLAAYFVAQILAFRPDSPYVIAGYCAGSTIAFELARQLLQHGAAIKFIALFGGRYPTSFRVLPYLGLRLAHHVERVRTHARALASLPYRERRRYVTEILRRYSASRDTSHVAASDPVLALRARVEAATVVAVRRYTPRYFAGRVSLFLPNKQWLCSGYGLRRWRSVAQDIEEYCGPDGCEGELLLREPYVAGTAELFRRCREKSKIELTREPVFEVPRSSGVPGCQESR